ncbi:cation/H(+) antiporter 24-like [Syzygium oleosum]|uniref:cation/H(+) antiporter 24-like n=1 Tax=Syzygium oleosum TaxID=219896 RepID=UPI0011D206C1|nr:cation/H(+) antiporter 24-like [Syzygium oleosum]
MRTLKVLMPPPAMNIAHVSRAVHVPPPSHGDSGFLIKCVKTTSDDLFGISFDDTAENNLFSHVLLEVSFVIVVTRIIRFLLKPLRQPRIVSEILGGVLVGPSILSHIPKFVKYVYPGSANFVVRNVGVIGFMYFLFMAGVRTDMSMVRRSAKKHVYLALTGVFIPSFVVIVVGLIMRRSMNDAYGNSSSIAVLGSSTAVTSFPVLYPILKELNLLNSEVGRLALSSAIVGDMIGIVVVILFEAAIQAKTGSIKGLWCLATVVVTMAIMFLCIRPAASWIIRNTPEGKPVDQPYIIVILVGVLVTGFLTDFLGVGIANGPLWLGLMIPDGPPLGTTLVERSDTIIMELLMPFSFMYIGQSTDLAAMGKAWSNLKPILAIVAIGHFTKVVSSLLAGLLIDMPVADGLALGLIMTLRGQVDVLLFAHWSEKEVIQPQVYTMMVMLSAVVSAISTPLIGILYDPKKPYMVNRRRTIQHTPPSTEFGVVLKIHDEEDIARFINFIEVSNPTVSTPISIYGLHLMQLVGRGYPRLFDHKKLEQYSKYAIYETIHQAMKLYQESKSECISYHAYTAMSPKQTMFRDICELALINKATLILLPYHKNLPRNHHRTVLVSNVLDNAPCSVGILLDKGHFRSNSMPMGDLSAFRAQSHQLVLLFLGGADAREALYYADRMVGNLNVRLTVIRFLAHDGLGDDEMEKKLDDGVVTWFWMKNEVNRRVHYREVEVRNGEETVATVHAMNDNTFDLWIVGRKQGINPVLLQGLTDWSDNNDLGVIGDLVSSMDCNAAASVLVVQQQVLREQKHWLRRFG